MRATGEDQNNGCCVVSDRPRRAGLAGQPLNVKPSSSCAPAGSIPKALTYSPDNRLSSLRKNVCARKVCFVESLVVFWGKVVGRVEKSMLATRMQWPWRLSACPIKSHHRRERGVVLQELSISRFMGKGEQPVPGLESINVAGQPGDLCPHARADPSFQLCTVFLSAHHEGLSVEKKYGILDELLVLMDNFPRPVNLLFSLFLLTSQGKHLRVDPFPHRR